LLEAAQRYELASAFDHHFLDVALQALGRAHRQGRQMLCLVPLSKSAITSPTTAEFIARKLLRLNIPGDGLCLMFTEDVGSHHASQLVEFSRLMEPLGCRIALSEFGNGAASFSHLNALRPSHLRLSQSLTRDIESGHTSTALLRAILEIAREQGIKTIAEGVDDTLLLDCLRNLAVDYTQGKAVAPREPFEAWFEGVVMRGCVE
jgi:EAL domain-containing protein (putative c-di-GMP-specific phosphodiesterase class I)